MLGTMKSYAEIPTPPRIEPPVYLLDRKVVALTESNPTLTEGLPFCEVVDGMPQWLLGECEHRLVYRELRRSLSSLGLTFSALNGRLLYKTPPIQSRRPRMRRLSGLIINRMADLARAIHKADEANASALKLYQMLSVDHRAVLEHHLKEGPHVAAGYELHEHRDELVQIGLLTPCVMKGKMGSVVANMTAVHVYNAGVTSPAEARKDRV